MCGIWFIYCADFDSFSLLLSRARAGFARLVNKNPRQQCASRDRKAEGTGWGARDRALRSAI